MTQQVLVRRDTSISVVNQRGPTRVVVGSQGARGIDGTSSGVTFGFSSSTTDSDPGPGAIRFNNVTLASATAAYVDNNDINGVDVSAWLDTFDDAGDSSLRGQIMVEDTQQPGTFRIYLLSGSVIDGSGYRKLTLTHKAGNGSFVAGRPLQLFFFAAGPLAQASDSGDGTPAMDGIAARGTSTHFARADHVHPTDTSRAPLASPALTGTPIAPTPASGDNSTKIATTAFAQDAIKRASAIPHIIAQADPFPPVPFKFSIWANWEIMPWIDPLWNWARSTPATYSDRSGSMRTAAVNEPRFHTIFATGDSGALGEPTSTNLLLQSETYDQSPWARDACLAFGSGSVANAIAAVDGNFSADFIVPDPAAGAVPHIVRQTLTVATGQVHTQSRLMKAGGYSKVQLLTRDVASSANSAFAIFDLVAGTASAGSVTGTFSTVSASIEVFPDGWYRCSLTFTVGANTSIQDRAIILDASGTGSFTADGISGVYFGGAQFEQLAYASSYIVTTTSQVTRGADVLTRSNADNAINPREGAIFISAILPIANGGSRYLASLDNSSLNEIAALRWIASGVINGLVQAGGVSQASINSVATFAAGAGVRAALRYKADNFALSVNGAAPVKDSSGTVPTPTRIQIFGAAGSASYGGLIKKFGYAPRALPDSNLQAVSS